MKATKQGNEITIKMTRRELEELIELLQDLRIQQPRYEDAEDWSIKLSEPLMARRKESI